MKKTKEPITRLYVVTDVASNKAIALVRATGVAQATRYIAEKTFTVAYAEQADIISAVKAGLEEESALEKEAVTEGATDSAKTETDSDPTHEDIAF